MREFPCVGCGDPVLHIDDGSDPLCYDCELEGFGEHG